MGYPMAVNLRSKIDSSKTLLICDVSEEALSKFEKQMEGKGPVKRVKNGFEAVQQAVCTSVYLQVLRDGDDNILRKLTK